MSTSGGRALLTAYAAVLVGACDRPGEAPAGPASGGEAVVARIDDRTITLEEFESRLRQESPFVQARYASPERRRELLENLVRFEVLTLEARKRGYERDPDVLRAAKQRLVEKMIVEEIDRGLDPSTFSEAELESFYRQNPGMFTRPDAVRVSQILLPDRETAEKVAALARALPAGAAASERAFRKLVAEHSSDEDSRQRGGDLTFVEKGSTELPRPVVEAAFGLQHVGDVSGPVQSDRGFHVLRLTERRPGARRPFAEIKAEVRNRLLAQRRKDRIDSWLAEMRKSVKVEVFADKLRSLAAEAPGTQQKAP